ALLSSPKIEPAERTKVTCMVFLQMVIAIQAYHKLGSAHGDLKPENIVLDREGKPRFIDHEEATESEEVNAIHGTPEYMAPEVASGKPHNPKKADIFSLGAILFAFLRGSLPKRGGNPDLDKKLFLASSFKDDDLRRANTGLDSAM